MLVTKYPSPKMRLLAIDPALRKSGFAILEKEGRKIRARAHGVIRNHTELSLTQCLLEIHRQTDQLIAQYLPECCAVESVIFVQNSRTAVPVGAALARGFLGPTAHGVCGPWVSAQREKNHRTWPRTRAHSPVRALCLARPR